MLIKYTVINESALSYPYLGDLSFKFIRPVLAIRYMAHEAQI